MNNLFIIGNGFDLAHGLKTRYSDFIVWYLDRALKIYKKTREYSDPVLSFRSSYSLNNTDGIFSIEDWIELIRAKLIRIDDINPMFGELINQFKSHRWVDIEVLYYKMLVRECKFGELRNSPEHITQKALEFNNCINFISTKLQEYLLSMEIEPSFYNYSIATHLKKYILGDSQKEREFHNSQHNFLLNFNYTDTLNLYQDIIKLHPSTQVVNIHGSIKQSNNPVIFGYGDELDPYYIALENFNNNELLINIKSFHYFKTDNYSRLQSFIDNMGQFQIIIMGHSCGISDRILLNTIFENKNCKFINILYYKKNDSDYDYFEKTQEISRHFKPENKAMMRERIRPFLPDNLIESIQYDTASV